MYQCTRIRTYTRARAHKLTHTLTRAHTYVYYTYIYTVAISYKGEAITACTCLADGRVLSSKKNFSFYFQPPQGLASCRRRRRSSSQFLPCVQFHFVSVCSRISVHFFIGWKKIRPSRQITFETPEKGGGKSFFFLYYYSIQTQPPKINCVGQLYCP